MPAALLLAVYVAALAVIAIVDLRTLRAPNRIVYPVIGFAVIASLTLSRSDMTEALLGALVATGVLLVIAILGRGAMGFGDVKYGTIGGAAVGLGGVLPMLAFTFVGGAVIAAVVLLLRLRDRKDVVAFTPFLFAGILFSIVWSPSYLIA